MGNLIRADIYKFLKSKSFLVCTIISIGLAIASVFLMDFAKNAMTMVSNGAEVTTQAMYGTLDASHQMGMSVNGNTPLFMAIFLSIFVGMEFNLGTIKNVATKAYSRTQIYISKLIVSFLGTLVITAITAAAFVLTALALWGFGNPESGFAVHTLQMYGIEMLIHLAYASVFIMIAMLVRSSGVAIAVSICLQQFVGLGISLLEFVVNKVFDWDVTLSNYLLSTNMTAVATKELTGELMLRSTLVALVFLLGAALIGIITFRKRDIK